mgnify:CR=1 FL=1
MTIPPNVVEAAITDADKSILVQPSPATRARRVILALAEDMPDSAVEKALTAFYKIEGNYWPPRGADVHGIQFDRDQMSAAIAAFLKHVAGDSP